MIDINEKKNCEIIQDLLPNYIEQLTSEKTNQQIEEHLYNCKECKKMFNDMRKEVELHTKKSDDREINFLKKYENKLKISRLLLLIILVILFIFIINTGRKIAIISDLSNKATTHESSTNFHVIEYSYNQGNYKKMEMFKLENKVKMIITIVRDGDKKTITMFGNEKIPDYNDRYLTNIYVETEDNKVVYLNQNIGISNIFIKDTLSTENWWDLYKYSMKSNITKTTYNGNECYYITNFQGEKAYSNMGMYIDKNTGLSINNVAYEYNNSDGTRGRTETTELIYNFDTVTEDDFIEPNIAEYETKDAIVSF